MQKTLFTVAMTILFCGLAFIWWEKCQPRETEAVSSHEAASLIASIYCDPAWVICPNDWQWITNKKIFVKVWSGQVTTRTDILVLFNTYERGQISRAAQYRHEALSRDIVLEALRPDKK